MRITKVEHYKFIKASLDDSQVHTDIDVARALGATSRIIHGVHQVLCILNYLKIPEAEISYFNFNFIKPLSVDQNFKIEHNTIGNKIYVRVENSITEFTSGQIVLKNSKPKLNNSFKKLSLIPDNDKYFPEIFRLNEFNFTAIFALYPWIQDNISTPFLKTLMYISFYFGVEKSSKQLMLVNIQIKENAVQKSSEIQSIERQNGKAEFLTLKSSEKFFEAIGRKYELYDFKNSNLNLNLGKYGHQKAVIFGGTGSLGSTFAKLLIRDGSQVHVTYRSKKKLNKIFEHEIGSFTPWQYDLLKSKPPKIEGITHLYYLLSPPIFLSNKPDFSVRISDIFYEYYIDNLKKVIAAYSSSSLQYIFSPSTKAIEDPSLILKEYIKIKTDMEILLKQTSISNPDLIISYPRIEAFESLQTIHMPKFLKKTSSEIAYNHLPITS